MAATSGVRIPKPGDFAAAFGGTEVEPAGIAWKPTEHVDGIVGPFRGPAAVAIARTQVGVAESGGEDRGVPYERYVRHFGNYGPEPWCAFFVSWCFNEAGYSVPWSNPGYVPSVFAWARSAGALVETPEHGDMFGLGGEHLGFVVGADPVQKVIFTCEGNWSDRVLCRDIPFAGAWFARY